MGKLQPKKIKLHAKIITPIHINNGEVYDRIDYYIDQETKILNILDRKWLVDCGNQDRELFDKIISFIEKGNFKDLENFKNLFLKNNYEKYLIEKIKLGNSSEYYLFQQRNANNPGFVNKFIRNNLDNSIYIPGSTLKGIYRTMFLYRCGNSAKNIDNSEDTKQMFSFINFSDVKPSNFNIEIQTIKSKTKPKPQVDKFGNLITDESGNPIIKPKNGIPQTVELITNGEFEIYINGLESVINENLLNSMIEKYSNGLINREKMILNNIKSKINLDNIFKNIKEQGFFPIKIGMFKKSLAYKINWEDMIDDLNKIEGRKWLSESRKQGIGDKTLYFDENQNPIGWIAVKIVNN